MKKPDRILEQLYYHVKSAGRAFLTGDHTKMGDHPSAKPVFDLDSVSLLHTACQLEKGVDLGGQALVGEPPKFAKGAVVSPCSDSVDAQLAKMERKVMAGITGVELAAKVIKECRPYCQGLHIMALGWEAKVPELMKLAGI